MSSETFSSGMSSSPFFSFLTAFWDQKEKKLNKYHKTDYPPASKASREVAIFFVFIQYYGPKEQRKVDSEWFLWKWKCFGAKFFLTHFFFLFCTFLSLSKIKMRWKRKKRNIYIILNSKCCAQHTFADWNIQHSPKS